MAVSFSVDVGTLRHAVQQKYADVALTPDKGFHFHTGRPLAQLLGYPEDILEQLPGECVESFAGVGNPFSLGEIKAGERVMDVGSGAGFDCLVAAHLVGPQGTVSGVDMTPQMVEKARHNASRVGATNVTFHQGQVEQLPLPDASADVVITNGVINLVPDKEAVLGEIFRVLVPGGRLYLSDIMVHVEVPDEARQAVELWTDWIGGALLEGEYLDAIRRAGFEDVELVSKTDVFAGTGAEERARSFKTLGANIRARKP